MSAPAVRQGCAAKPETGRLTSNPRAVGDINAASSSRTELNRPTERVVQTFPNRFVMKGDVLPNPLYAEGPKCAFVKRLGGLNQSALAAGHLRGMLCGLRPTSPGLAWSVGPLLPHQGFAPACPSPRLRLRAAPAYWGRCAPLTRHPLQIAQERPLNRFRNRGRPKELLRLQGL